MKTIAYTYEADFHCPACTKKRFGSASTGVVYLEPTDQHGIPYEATDSEGNLVCPVSGLDELPCDLPPEAGGYSPVICGDCQTVIKERSR
jgi:hypothetical protein